MDKFGGLATSAGGKVAFFYQCGHQSTGSGIQGDSSTGYPSPDHHQIKGRFRKFLDRFFPVQIRKPNVFGHRTHIMSVVYYLASLKFLEWDSIYSDLWLSSK